MSNILGSLQVNLTANTSSFATELDKASAKARAAAAQIRKELQATGKEAEGTQALFSEAFGIQIPRHIRGLISELPGVGKALSAAFSAVAIIVVIETLVEAGKKVSELVHSFNEMGEAAKKNADNWLQFQTGLRLTNDELAISTDQLLNELAVLENKPKNMLKLALDETTQASDKLVQSLRKATDETSKTLKGNQLGFLDKLIHGKEDNAAGPAARMKELQDQVTDKGQERLDAIDALDADVKNGKVKAGSQNYYDTRKKIEDDYNQKLRELYAKAEQQFKIDLAKAEKSQRVSDENSQKYSGAFGAENFPAQPKDANALILALKEAIRTVHEQNSFLQLTDSQTDAKKRLEAKQAADEAAKPGNMVQGVLASLQQQVNASKELLDVSTKDNEQRRIALATNKANADIVKLGTELAKEKNINTKGFGLDDYIRVINKVNPEAVAKIRGAEATIAANGAQAQLNQTIATGTRETILHVQQAERLRAAIMQGSAAVQQANAYNQAEAELHAQNATQAQIQARAIEIVNEANAKGRATAAQTLVDLAEESRQRSGLNAALLEGADAYRQAQLNQRLAQIDVSNKTDAEKSAEKQKAIYDSQADATTAIYTAVGKLTKADDDRLKILQQELTLLRVIGAAHADIKKVEDEMGTIWDKQRMDTGKASAGAQVYFDELVRNAKTAAQQMHDILADSVDGINSELAKAMTGQQTNFGNMFRGLAEKLAKQSLENIESSVLKLFGFGNKPDGTANNPLYVQIANGTHLGGAPGKLGDLVAGVFHRAGVGKQNGPTIGDAPLGGIPGIGKPDGSVNNPFFVVDGKNSPGGALSGGVTGLLGKLFNHGGGSNSDTLAGGEGSTGGLDGVFSDGSDSGGIDGFAANGGDLEPYKTYMVGEKGPELFTPGAAGHVTPNHHLENVLGGRSNNTYHIDARGTNPAEVDMRVRRGMQQTHAASVQAAVVLNREYDIRRPASRGGARF